MVGIRSFPIGDAYFQGRFDVSFREGILIVRRADFQRLGDRSWMGAPGTKWITPENGKSLYIYISPIYSGYFNGFFSSPRYPKVEHNKSGEIIATSPDLGPQKVAFWKGHPLISGKSRLVKYFNLARWMDRNGDFQPFL